MGCRQCYHIISSAKEKSAKVGLKKDGKKQGNSSNLYTSIEF